MSQQLEYNIVIRNNQFIENMDLIPLLFNDESYISFESTQKDGRLTDMYDVLVFCGFFKSKSEARKNWKKTGKDIPDGFTDIQKIGKLRRRLTIWKAI